VHSKEALFLTLLLQALWTSLAWGRRKGSHSQLRERERPENHAHNKANMSKKTTEKKWGTQKPTRVTIRRTAFVDCSGSTLHRHVKKKKKHN